MAVLTIASSMHHRADTLEDMGRYDDARVAVVQVLALEIPTSVQEREDIRLDAWARAAEIDLARGQPESTVTTAESGLKESSRDSVLRARLLDVKGRGLTALARAAKLRGDARQANTFQSKALEMFDQSIRINEGVLDLNADGGLNR